MGKDDEIHIKSSTVTKAIIGVLVLIILVLLYFVATNHGTTSLSSANQTIASQNARINGLQANISSLQSENNNLQTQNNNQQRLLASDNNTIASLSGSLNTTKSTTTSCSVIGLANLTATPSFSTTVIANPLNTAITPLLVLDYQANNASILISIGNKNENSVSSQIQAEYGVNIPLNGYIVQAYGSHRILVAGNYSSQTVAAGNQFIQALLAQASNTNSGISFEGIPIINNAGQPVVQVVVGSLASPSSAIVAGNIAAAIGSLAHTSTNVIATVNGRSGISCVVSH